MVTYIVLRWYFLKQLRAPIDSAIANHLLDHHGKMMLVGLLATAIVLLAASALH
jgi:hypothetical protein